MLTSDMRIPIIRNVVITSGAILFSSLFYYYYKKQSSTYKERINKVITTSDFSVNDTQSYRKHVKSIIELIDKATRSIYIAMYLFTIRDFSSALIRAQRRGVDIRIVLDGTMINCMGSQKSKLLEEGIEVRYNKDLNYLIHHKFCLIDSEKQNWLRKIFRKKDGLPDSGIVITGSQNWTRQALTGNWEYQIFTCNKEIVAIYNEEFHRVWKRFETSYSN